MQAIEHRNTNASVAEMQFLSLTLDRIFMIGVGGCGSGRMY